MRRLVAACVAAAALVAIAAPAASAAPASIVGTPANAFTAPTYMHDAGTIASFTSTGGTHNATSTAQGPDGQPLFFSDTISSGGAPVSGTQYLALGSYQFVCTIHPSTMSASLNVNAGTPLARPDVSLKVKSKDLDRVLRRDELKVKVEVSGGSGEQAKVNVKLGAKKLTPLEGVTGTQTVPFSLTNKGEKILSSRSKAKVTVLATIDFGSPASAKGTLK